MMPSDEKAADAVLRGMLEHLLNLVLVTQRCPRVTFGNVAPPLRGLVSEQWIAAKRKQHGTDPIAELERLGDRLPEEIGRAFIRCL